MSSSPLIELHKISVRLPEGLFLENTSWTIHSDEHWAVLGPNGSGKSTLVKCLFGAVPVVRGSITYHEMGTGKTSPSAGSSRIGYVSSELHRSVFERETLKDSFRDFSGNIDDVTTLRDMILEGIPKNNSERQKYANRLDRNAPGLEIDGLLLRDIKTLSTGDISKALIARALIKQPRLLILDEPFEGLDKSSRIVLSGWINELMQRSMQVILVTHRIEEILPNITHVLFLRYGKVFDYGKRETKLTPAAVKKVYEIDDSTGHQKLLEKANKISALTDKTQVLGQKPKSEAMPVLIDMRNVNVIWGGKKALNGFNWVMKAGENWALCGPSGAGKTTVLKLILGENLQAYANEIYLFGSRKGHGESLWDIKKRIGFISSELQKKHPHYLPVLDIVCSGFHDTVGLYKRCNIDELNTAKEWMEILDITDLAESNFGRLSHGQKQLVLIARAMVKLQVLLILDEPCDGLDIANRQKVIHVLDLIGHLSGVNLLYVPNRDDEMLSCITHILKMDAGRVEKWITRKPISTC
ncbi:MAG: ATP-binding cassette domain-containing protein [Deltaproteobacteria bacterium]|jgi:molybdate transport system ATP-binding protein|nr:ATP-binding cassette domain-containing protein [Deltaproteobacteria bacterium]